MADLHQKLAELQGLLPSQRQWLERLVFQLEFNPYQLINLVGGPGSGKSTLALAIADLLSDEFNLALLTVEPELGAPRIRQHLLEQWFGYGHAADKPLLTLIGERESRQPLAVILDRSAYLPAELWAELAEIPCLVIATAEQTDPHAELNMPLAPLTMEDAEVLLQDSAFSTLSVAERLEQAQGNIHLLLNPQLAVSTARQKPATPTVQASFAGPLWVFTIGIAAIVAVVVFWFWSERQGENGNGLGTLTYLPEEQEVAAVPVKEAPPPPPAERAVVEKLVNELEQVKGDKASTAGLERPVDFTEQTQAAADTQISTTPAETTAAEEQPKTIAEPAPQQSPVELNSQTADTATKAAEQTTAAADTSPANSKAENTAPAQSTEQPQNSAIVQEPAEDLAAEIEAEQTTPTPPAKTSLPPESTVEDEMAAALSGDTAVTTQPVTTPAEDLAAEAAAELTQPVQSKAPAQSTPSQTATAPTGGYAFDEAALLSLPGNEFALQLVVFSNESALNSFRQTYRQLKTYTYQRQKDGKRQLVVVMAPFASASAAKQQAASLPAPLQQGFGKALADIHSEISTN